MTSPTAAMDTLLSGLDLAVEFDAPIGPAMTWYRLGGRADCLVRPRTVDALIELVRRCRDSGVTLRVLGSGANLLVAEEGVDGVVVRLDQPAFEEWSIIHRHRPNRGGRTEAGDGARVMAGAALERLVMQTARGGLAGLETLAGIPASIGGAIRMNAGGKFGAIGDVVAAVACLDLDGNVRVHRSEDIRFHYRRCSIVDPVILWAELALRPEDPARLKERVREIMAFKSDSQPLGRHSCGCVFKNPKSMDEPGTRVSAGMLIDRAGLKGTRVGGAAVSQRHGNFFMAEPGCTADDVIGLIEMVEAEVEKRTGYRLERELVIWKRKSREGALR